MPDGVCPFIPNTIGQVNTHGPEMWDHVGFCDHTAGGYMSTMLNPNFWNTQRTSPHFAVAQDGGAVQVVNIFEQAWCQGRDQNGNSVGPDSPGITWAPFVQMSKRNPNGYLISTEHEDKTVSNYAWSSEMYSMDLRIKRWVDEEVRRVKARNILRFGIDSLAGHHMFDPRNRPYCPGTGWPRARLFQDLAGGELPMIDHSVTATWFNNRDIAQGPTEGYYIMQARSDFNLPASARRVKFAVYMASGPGYMRFWSKDKEADSVGWGVTPIFGTVEVEMTDGTIPFRADNGPVRTAVVRCLGYWT